MEFIVVGIAAFGIVGLVGALMRWLLVSPVNRKIEEDLELIRAGKMPEIAERTDFDYEILPDSDGFSVISLQKNASPPISCKWNAVVDATAYKVDLWATDQVRIAFRMTDSSVIEVHEEMKGWIDFCDSLPVHLPGTPPLSAWFMQITTPAFEPCITPLYPKESQNDEELG